MSGFFVTGTDTEIGKTVVSAALVRYLGGEAGHCVGMKPVASGAESTADGLRNADALALMAATTVPVEYADVNPYVFAEPTAPHLVAASEGVAIAWGPIGQAYERLRRRASRVVVEGVGGWLVPLAPGYDVEAMASDFDLPVVLVVGLRLGCLNHALLTERAIISSGCRLAGWIANHLSPDFSRAAQNIDTLKTSMRSPMLAEVAWHEDGPERAILDSVDRGAIDAALAAGRSRIVR